MFKIGDCVKQKESYVSNGFLHCRSSRRFNFSDILMVVEINNGLVKLLNLKNLSISSSFFEGVYKIN